MPSRHDVAIVGAGIVGLATALRLLEGHPALRVAVLDKEHEPGGHQSSHNSGVLHAGLYYAAGSRKARLCREGKASMERYAAERGIPFERCGKLVVAVEPDERPRLRAIADRARTNGVEGIREVGADEMAEIEPAVRGVAGVYSPTSGIIDFSAVVRALTRDVGARGAELLFAREVVGLERASGDWRIATTAGDVAARYVVTCAGLQSDRLAALTGDAGAQRIVPFRGDYFVLRPEARRLVRGLVYPVNDPRFPFLGVHLTRRIDGEVWAGPNAVLAFAREGYRRRDVSLHDLAETLTYRGFLRVALRHWRVGAEEMWRDISRSAYAAALQRYVPELRDEDLLPGPSGVRAQSVRLDGTLVDDFSFGVSNGIVHVRNAPSPGATASLAIGREIAELAERTFGLD